MHGLLANHKAINVKYLRGAVEYMVEAASKKDFAPGKGRILKATLVSIGIPPISLEIIIMLKSTEGK